ncbi:ribonuclease P protein subunit p29 [Leptidea sinapis]|uniref:ribonuclease P protein subunit p29 n=1 Tax=Leptidea sinapis TaxID=189913 RepID=UPI0021C49E33|nr:ribonuclease P protein subunit p29 [Leptidea sinapis]
MSFVEVKDEASERVLKFLESNVRKKDHPHIETELKKDFLLGKKRSKQQSTKKNRKSKIITRKEKNKLGFYDFPRNCLKYSDMVPLNELWNGYISQMLELDKPIPAPLDKRWEQFSQTFYKADFHGSRLHVVRSKCPSYVDIKGICVMDTKNTFKIISENNIITTIPKKESVFNFYVKNIIITIFGKHICIRPAERSTKKFKSHSHLDL